MLVYMVVDSFGRGSAGSTGAQLEVDGIIKCIFWLRGLGDRAMVFGDWCEFVIPDAIDLIRSVNAGDLAPDRRQVLENLHPAIRPHHLTRCFFQRMPPPERAKILKSMPTATDHDDAKRFAYQHQYEQLKEVWASKGKFCTCSLCDVRTSL